MTDRSNEWLDGFEAGRAAALAVLGTVREEPVDLSVNMLERAVGLPA